MLRRRLVVPDDLGLAVPSDDREVRVAVNGCDPARDHVLSGRAIRRPGTFRFRCGLERLSQALPENSPEVYQLPYW